MERLIIVITVVSFFALAWVIISIYFSSPGTKTSDGQNHQPVWDEDLREGGNAPPLWWFWLILCAMVFSVIYLILYPGLGSFKGVLHWSQDSRIDASYQRYEQQYSAAWTAIEIAELSEVQNNPEYMATAGRLFTQHCAACHGYEAQGQVSLFPNLTDDDWQWGGSPAQIEQTIRAGRSAAMIAWQAILGDDGVNQMASYVLALSKGQAEGHPGQAQFTQNCIACHNVDGTGNPLLGAPNLADDIWLYGGDEESVKSTIAAGRFGIMPAFKDRLDDVQIKLLAAFLTQP